WIILLIVLQAATWPMVKRIFTRLPDRGWAFSRVVTMLVAAYPIWLLASLGWISFRAVWAIVSVVLVAAISWGLLRRVRVDDHEQRSWRNPYIVSAEVVFWVVFALFLL